MAANHLSAPVFLRRSGRPALLNGSQAFSQGLGAQPKSQVKALVGRLELERYKTTIKGLTQFGGRQQGTDRNGAALVSDADVVTERSIRFVLWNGEESGHVGSRA
jgi:Zn-dependent M28 family amino/carboxypeptidase